MRLNLGEIARILDCGPGQVLWNGSDAARGAENSPGAPGSVRDCRESSPWAGITPSGAEIDSRRLAPGNLFFCLPGERSDGHAFARDAARAGASAIIALRDPFAAEQPDGRAESSSAGVPPVFLVSDVLRALWRIAMRHRDSTPARVIGVTGSAGKTSVKEVLAQVLDVRGSTQRNHMNHNNQIGLPVSMLNAAADAAFWVMELGISQAGDMDELGSILRPDAALILNVGDAHVLGLGKQGVAASKSRLLSYIRPSGLAVLSLDYPDLNEELEGRLPELSALDIRCLRFSGMRAGAGFRAEYLGVGRNDTGRYHVCAGETEFTVETPFRGAFGAENVAAITAVAMAHGLHAREIARGFSLARLPEQRFQNCRLGPFTLLDDSYNANPLSAKRMVEAAAAMAEEYRQALFLVMGEMLELGDKAESSHEALGGVMAKVSPSLIFWKGGQAGAVLRGLRSGGYTGGFFPVSGGQDFSALLEELAPESGLFLFKGSRGNRLERLVDIFRLWTDSGNRNGDTDAV